jgi:hypothetical protein
LHGFGEHHISARFDVRAGPVDSCRKALARNGIRPRHDHEIGSGSRICRGPDPVDHFGFRYESLSRAVSAAFRLNLILEVHGSRACAFHTRDGARDIEARAPPGVDVHQQWKGAYVCDPSHIHEHVF